MFLDLPLGRFYAIKGIDLGFGFEKRKITRTRGKGGRGGTAQKASKLEYFWSPLGPRATFENVRIQTKLFKQAGEG